MTNFDKIKKSKLFAKADVIVYAAVFALIVALFAVFVWNAPKENLTGISAQVSENGQTAVVFYYDFDSGVWTTAEGWEERIEVEETASSVVVRFIFGDEFNLLTISKTERSAVMTDANCSFHRDCTKFPPITDGGGVIICIPHGLTVSGVGELDLQPSVG